MNELISYTCFWKRLTDAALGWTKMHENFLLWSLKFQLPGACRTTKYMFCFQEARISFFDSIKLGRGDKHGNSKKKKFVSPDTALAKNNFKCGQSFNCNDYLVYFYSRPKSICLIWARSICRCRRSDVFCFQIALKIPTNYMLHLQNYKNSS